MKRIRVTQVCAIVMTMLATTFSQAPVDKKLDCRLVWREMTSGDRITPDLVASQLDNLYVVRSKFEDEFVVGTYSVQETLAYFPVEEAEFNSSLSDGTSFEILTNPHECILEWISNTAGNKPPKFTVKSDQYNVVAKASVFEDDGNWYAGGLADDEEGIYVAYMDEDGEPLFLESYDVLISYSIGVDLEISDFHFLTDPFANAEDFLGVDEIQNFSPATIKQTIFHSKKIIEKYKITTNRTWTSTYTETLTINLWFFKIKKEKKTTYTHSESETVETTEITDISVSRSIEIPPFMAIQACTLISIKECAEVSYRAKAKYSARGLNSIDLYEILKNDIRGARIDGDFVVVDVTGEFTAAIALNTRFLVRPHDSLQNCDAIQSRINSQKSNRISM